MAKEQAVKNVLLDMLGEEKKVLVNEIPRNVDSSYKVFLDLNMKELLIVFLPSLLFLGIAFLSTFLMGILNMFTSFLIIIIALVVWFTLYGLLTIKPVSEKSNLRMLDFMKIRQRYSNRQKVFFYKGQNNGTTISGGK